MRRTIRAVKAAEHFGGRTPEDLLNRKPANGREEGDAEENVLAVPVGVFIALTLGGYGVAGGAADDAPAGNRRSAGGMSGTGGDGIGGHLKAVPE